MKRIRIIGLCLVAVFAMSAVLASSASAAAFAPERGTCKAAKKGAGEYLDSLCLTPGLKGGTKKEFVWTPSKTGSLSLKSGPAKLRSLTPEGAELPAVECNKSKGTGKVSATGSTSKTTFEECSSSGEKCTGGAKAKPGDIITFELEGKLGIIEGEKVGESIAGKGPGGLSAEFKCGPNEIKSRGSVIAEETPVNTKASTTKTLVFAQSAGHQIPEKFEGGPKETIETELDGLGGGTFPFSSSQEETITVKAPSSELRA